MSFGEAMRRAGLLIAALACVLASRADAQRIADVAPGSRVRIAVDDSLRQSPYMSRSRSITGTLARATSDTLWLHVAGPDTVRVPRTTLRRMEVSRGASRVRSALEQGFAVALTFGLAAYVAADDSDERRENFAIVGSTAILAAIIGAVRPYERWRRVR